MAITNGYATLAQLKSFLTISDSVDDAVLEYALNAASRAIDAHCRRRFYVDALVSARTYRAVDTGVLDVDDFSTTTGLIVKTDTGDNGTYDTTWTITTDFVLAPSNGVVDGLSGWPYTTIYSVNNLYFPNVGARPRVEVTAKWGWAAVPDAVFQACLLLAAEQFKLKDAPFGVAGYGELGVVRVRDNTKAAELLRPYRRHAAVIA